MLTNQSDYNLAKNAEQLEHQQLDKIISLLKQIESNTRKV